MTLAPKQLEKYKVQWTDPEGKLVVHSIGVGDPASMYRAVCAIARVRSTMDLLNFEAHRIDSAGGVSIFSAQAEAAIAPGLAEKNAKFIQIPTPDPVVPEALTVKPEVVQTTTTVKQLAFKLPSVIPIPIAA